MPLQWPTVAIRKSFMWQIFLAFTVIMFINSVIIPRVLITLKQLALSQQEHQAQIV